MDAHLKERFPSSPRWDYGIGHATSKEETTVWVEVHPANSTHIQDVLNKLRWLKTWLNDEAPDLKAMTSAYVWAATGTVALCSPQRRRLAQEGLLFTGKQVTLPLGN